MKDSRDPMDIIQETVGYDTYRRPDQEPSEFTIAFLKFISACEKLDLRLQSVTFKKQRPPAKTEQIGVLYGIELYSKDTP